ncbi:MAG: hypothetical protein AAFZ80_03900 [Cyanobacteria bacterium P01_A01_bin.105]
MFWFSNNGPILRWKQAALDVQDIRGLLTLHWQWGDRTLFRYHFTRIDQVFLLWGWVTACIFLTAQFCSISWTTQTVLWSGLTLTGIVAMVRLAWFWVRVERLRWLMYLWSGLMVGGIAATAWGIFGGVGWILLNLCGLWLMLCAVGYLAMALGMESRSFLGAAAVHGLAALTLAPAWQFVTTALVMAGSLWLFACVQWDMRLPIEPDVLSPEEIAFNRSQQALRQP